MASGMNNLTTLIKRLEAATSRLEDIASTTSIAEGSIPTSQTLKTSDTNGESASAGETSSQQPASTPVPESVEAFDAIIKDDLKPFSTISDSLGGVVAEQSSAFADAFKAQREVILIASRAKEPSQATPVYMEILKDLVQGIETVNSTRDKNRKSPQENHLAMLSDGVAILSWVTMKPSPDSYVAEVLGGAQFYGNKILTAFKDKDTQDVDWVKAFVKLCGALIQYIKQYHPKGLEWNLTGITPEDALQEVRAATASSPLSNGTAAASSGTDKSTASASTSTAAAATAAPPPPPPPPPPPIPQSESSASLTKRAASAGDMDLVFEQLNKGEGVTAGLRKVDKSEMTHKNPSLRAQSSVPDGGDAADANSRAKSPAPPVKKQKPESMRAKKPSRKELDGHKWTVEHFENEQSPVEIDAERQQSVLISRCKATTVKINGKANAIAIDNCSRLDVLVDSLVSSVEVINSNNFRMQILGTLPSVQLDKVDGGTIFLSQESLNTEIFTSKCSSINITLPPKGEQDDSVECPVPEQLKTTVVDGKLVSEIVKQEG